MAAKALVTPARMIETTMAEPAPTWPESPAMAVPIAAKMPAPMMAPMPSAVSWTGPRDRLRPPPASPSAMHWATVLRAKSWLRGPRQGVRVIGYTLATGWPSRVVAGLNRYPIMRSVKARR